MEKKNFKQLLKELEQCKDITPIVKAQKNTLLRYEEINEMLRQFLELSNNTQTMLLENYTIHVKTLIELKNDLEHSFRRIRTLKEKLKEKYPDAFDATSAAIKELEDKNRQFQEDDFDIFQQRSNKQNDSFTNGEETSDNRIKSIERIMHATTLNISDRIEKNSEDASMTRESPRTLKDMVESGTEGVKEDHTFMISHTSEENISNTENKTNDGES